MMPPSCWKISSCGPSSPGVPEPALVADDEAQARDEEGGLPGPAEIRSS